MTSVPDYYLCLHGVGESGRDYEPDEERYWINPAQLDELIALKCELQPLVNIALTFDDSNASDHDVVADRLAAAGLRAWFFVLADKLGSRSYMDAAQVRALAAAGHTIGTHGLRHVDWRQVAEAELQAEIHGSRAKLEQAVGVAIEHLAIPFGSYDRRVLSALSGAGYTRHYSCDGGPRLASTSWLVPRMTIERTHTPAYLKARIRRDLTRFAKCSQEARILAKSLR